VEWIASYPIAAWFRNQGDTYNDMGGSINRDTQNSWFKMGNPMNMDDLE